MSGRTNQSVREKKVILQVPSIQIFTVIVFHSDALIQEAAASGQLFPVREFRSFAFKARTTYLIEMFALVSSEYTCTLCTAETLALNQMCI